jgi:hypothetical protein
MAEPSEVPTPPSETRLPRREALRLHATLALGLTLCVAAFWFELSRALGGNALSWAYVFEWPLLGVFAVYMWWQLLHPNRDNRVNRKVKSLDPSFSVMLERWEESRDDLERSRGSEGDDSGT